MTASENKSIWLQSPGPDLSPPPAPRSWQHRHSHPIYSESQIGPEKGSDLPAYEDLKGLEPRPPASQAQ